MEPDRDVFESMALSHIELYRGDATAKPFFVAVDDAHAYRALREGLALRSSLELRLSDFCRANDVKPDFDAMLTYLQNAVGFTVLIGLGEFLSLTGLTKTEAELSRMKETVLPIGTKVVVLLRGCRNTIGRFCEDPRFADRQAYLPPNPVNAGLSVLTVVPSIGIDGAEWLKEALRELEDGKETVRIKTDLAFPDATVPVRRISRAFEALAQEWTVPEECGTPNQWMRFLKEGGAAEVFTKHDLSIYKPGSDYEQWLYFIEKKHRRDLSPYLSFVANRAANLADFDREMVFALLDVQPHDPRFETFYTERKTILKSLTDADMARYAAATKIKGENRLHYLTDNTEIECKGVIASVEGWSDPPLDQLARRYPSLAYYLRDFVFPDKRLTDYFRRYKRQKVANRIEAGFLDTVRDNAQSREYNLLPTRDSVIEQLDKANTALYFVDAMGVEFLGFIQARCAALGLQMEVRIARANLPSLTQLNKAFSENWPGKKYETRDLDKAKHGDADGFDYQQTNLPVHLVRELQIVGAVLERAKTELASGGSRKTVIASDHGASRLVVVNGQELKYEVDMRGTHSGRCCAECTAEGLDSATRENGWLVLADYGRFRGGRAAAVEVHGGATNEEVIVPVIELTLAGAKIEIKTVDSCIIANFRTTATLVLFSTTVLDDITLIINGRRYVAEKIEANRHRVAMPDIKRAGDYAAEVYEGANLLGTVRFTVKSGAAKENDLF